MSGFATKVDVSKAVFYKHIKELKDMDVVEETTEGPQENREDTEENNTAV